MKKEYKRLIAVETAIALVVLVIFICVKTDIINLIPKCIFYENLHVFCPACGGTRMVEYAFQFKFLEAFKMHPMFFMFGIYLGILNLVYIINVIWNKKIVVFKWWHIVIWTIFVVIYTICRNIN